MGSYVGRAAWWMNSRVRHSASTRFSNPFIEAWANTFFIPRHQALRISALRISPSAHGPGWGFLHYYARRAGNGYWSWWLDRMKTPAAFDDPSLDTCGVRCGLLRQCSHELRLQGLP